MDPTEDELTLWIDRLSNGDGRAAEVVWSTYFQKLVQYAGRRLGSLPKRVADEEDVALSAMHSFCRGMQAGSFKGIHNRDDFWKLLVTITARKVYRQIRHQTRQKRGGGIVRGESAFEASLGEDLRHGIAEVLGSEPTPELAASFAENCQILLSKLDDPMLQRIALLRLEGHSNEEIAAACDCATRTVERKLERIRRIWEPTAGSD